LSAVIFQNFIRHIESQSKFESISCNFTWKFGVLNTK